jgi:cytochrome b561
MARSRTTAAATRAAAVPTGYSALQIGLHWTIAALVIFQLVVNEAMQDAFDDRVDGDYVEDFPGAVLHIIVGLTVLALAIVRVIVRLTRGAPPPHRDKPVILVWVGMLTHLLLYGFIFAMPITGAIAWFGLSEGSAEFHELGRLILIPLIGFHALGGLAEHFVFRNDSFVRMLRPG